MLVDSSNSEAVVSRFDLVRDECSHEMDRSLHTLMFDLEIRINHMT